jgi:HlyD family secretion protein
MDKSKRKKLIIFGGALLAFILIIVFMNVKRKGGKIVVQTEKTGKGKVTATVSGSAKIQPEIQVKISAKVSGQILRLGVIEGQPVKKGQFLVQLDQEFYKADVEQSRSNVKFSHAGFDKSKSEYERVQKLFESKLASTAELEISKSTFEQSKAQVEQSEAMLNQAQDNLDKTTIYSPMDGVVSQLNKKVGEMAMGSQFTLDVIMVVADLAKMRAETEIDENDVVSVSLGDTAKVSIDAYPDTTFKGVVTEIANTGTTTGTGTQNEVINFLVKVLMIQKPPTLRPSMSSTVDIITEVKNGVIKVPIQCVTVRQPLKPKPDPKAKAQKADSLKKAEAKIAKKDKKKDAKPDSAAVKKGGETASEKEEKPVKVVFVVKSGIAHQVTVETGISSDTDIEIVKGLSEGDEIVSGSYRILSKQLKDGDKVTVNNALKKKFREEGEEEKK